MHRKENVEKDETNKQKKSLCSENQTMEFKKGCN
jgi:hypothetical protein